MNEATRLSTAVRDEPRAGELKIERALLSVSDKRGLVDFGRALAELGV